MLCEWCQMRPKYLRWEVRGDARKVLHLLAQPVPGHGAVGSNSHIPGRGDNERQFEGLHGGRVC